MISVIHETDIPATVKSFPRGRFISVLFWKKDGSLRRALAMMGVHNPADPDMKPKGVGETQRMALEKDRFKFYDATKRGYRQARFEGIIWMACDGHTYVVDHNKQSA
jgi:hypothetical protein